MTAYFKIAIVPIIMIIFFSVIALLPDNQKVLASRTYWMSNPHVIQTSPKVTISGDAYTQATRYCDIKMHKEILLLQNTGGNSGPISWQYDGAKC